MTQDYKHLRPSEIEIFERFLEVNPLEEAIFDFDVHLGSGVPSQPHWPGWLVEMAKTLTQRRVDVVAYQPDKTWILEIKVRSGPSAIGQLLLYRQLFMEKFNPPELPLLGVIARRDSHDMVSAYFSNDITLFLV